MYLKYTILIFLCTCNFNLLLFYVHKYFMIYSRHKNTTASLRSAAVRRNLQTKYSKFKFSLKMISKLPQETLSNLSPFFFFSPNLNFKSVFYISHIIIQQIQISYIIHSRHTNITLGDLQKYSKFKFKFSLKMISKLPQETLSNPSPFFFFSTNFKFKFQICILQTVFHKLPIIIQQ